MEINKKELDKLSQLDRIELRQKRDSIERVFGQKVPSFLIINLISIFILGFLFTFNMFTTLYFRAVPITLKGFIWITIGLLIFTGIGALIDIIRIMKETKAIDCLIDEYFKLEVKKKRRK